MFEGLFPAVARMNKTRFVAKSGQSQIFRSCLPGLIVIVISLGPHCCPDPAGTVAAAAAVAAF